MPIERYNILNRYTGTVQFTAEIECDADALPSVKLGLAVQIAVKSGASLDGARLDRARLDRASLDGASLDGASLDRASLVGASLDGARLDGASLDGARLDRARLDRASLVGARLDRASLDGARLDGAGLDGARLDGASLVGARLHGASLVGARLVGASLDGASLDGARLDRARLDRASLVGARLDRARLDGARLDGATGLTDESLRSIKADMWMTLARATNEVPALIDALKNGRVDGSQYEGECACLVGTLANAAGVDYRATFTDASASHPAERWFAAIRKGDKPGDDTSGGFAATWALKWAEEFHALMGSDK